MSSVSYSGLDADDKDVDDVSDKLGDNKEDEKDCDTKKKPPTSFALIDKVRAASQAASRRRAAMQHLPFPRLKRFCEVEDEVQRIKLCAEKMSDCVTYMCDFSDPEADLQNKATKREWLQDIIEYVRNTNDRKLFTTQETYAALFEMVSANAFRAMPPRDHGLATLVRYMLADVEEEDVADPAWYHLEVVYQVFAAFLQRTEFSTSVSKRLLDVRFLRMFLSLFESEDSREREQLRNILHKIYTRFLTLRSLIRREIRNTFLTVVDEARVHHGITELLELLSSIINGFALPVKDEHKVYLFRTLMPLHRALQYPVYCVPLTNCIAQYLRKDPSLAVHVFNAMAIMWLKMSGVREVSFLHELQLLLDAIPATTFPQIRTSICEILLRCLDSPSNLLVEQTLVLIRSDSFMRMLSVDLQCDVSENAATAVLSPASPHARAFALVYRSLLKLSLQYRRCNSDHQYASKISECLEELNAIKPEYCAHLREKFSADKLVDPAGRNSQDGKMTDEESERFRAIMTKRKQLHLAMKTWSTDLRMTLATKRPANSLRSEQQHSALD